MTSPAKLATGKIPIKAKQAQPLALSSLSPRFSVQRCFRFSSLSNPPFVETHVEPTPQIRSVRSFEANESHRNRRKIVFSHEFNFTNGFPSPNLVFLSCHLLRSCSVIHPTTRFERLIKKCCTQAKAQKIEMKIIFYLFSITFFLIFRYHLIHSAPIVPAYCVFIPLGLRRQKFILDGGERGVRRR